MHSKKENIEVWTIGHSTHSYARFVSLLHASSISAVADVRSSPFSKHYPHFNKNDLKSYLKNDSIAYSFLGDELGGRPRNSKLYENGVASYDLMALTPEFLSGIDRIVDGTKAYRIAIMCSEHSPLDCHRCLLVGRYLKSMEISVNHILHNGDCKTQSEIEADLLIEAGVNENQKDLFLPIKERLENAYRKRSRKIAFSISETKYSVLENT